MWVIMGTTVEENNTPITVLVPSLLDFFFFLNIVSQSMDPRAKTALDQILPLALPTYVILPSFLISSSHSSFITVPTA